MNAKDRVPISQMLKGLDPEIRSRIDSKLLAGEPATELCAWLQDDLKLLPDVITASLKKALERYRKGDLLPRTLKRIANSQAGAGVKTVIKRLNAMDDLEALVIQQKHRVEGLLGRESTMPSGILLKDASAEMRLLKEMLVDLGRQQLETGLLPKAGMLVKGQVVGSDGVVQSFEWSVEQERLYDEIGEFERRAATQQP